MLEKGSAAIPVERSTLEWKPAAKICLLRFCVNNRFSSPIFPMTAPLTLNLLQGSVRFPFSPEAAIALQGEINQLVNQLKAIGAQVNQGGRPEKQQNLEYCHSGEVFLEVFCNPNIYPSPFAAKVLLTLRDDRIRLTTEAELPRLIEDLAEYLAQHG